MYNKFNQFKSENLSKSNVDFLENIYKNLNPEHNKNTSVNIEAFDTKLNKFYDFIQNNVKKMNCF